MDQKVFYSEVTLKVQWLNLSLAFMLPNFSYNKRKMFLKAFSTNTVSWEKQTLYKAYYFTKKWSLENMLPISIHLFEKFIPLGNGQSKNGCYLSGWSQNGAETPSLRENVDSSYFQRIYTMSQDLYFRVTKMYVVLYSFISECKSHGQFIHHSANPSSW